MKAPAEQVAKHFFQSLMHNQCHICWGLFSKKSQDLFIKWTLKDIYRRHGEAAQVSRIGPPEVRLLFENNDASLMKSFWKKFFFESGANEFFRYGYFNATDNHRSKTTVQILCIFPDGRRQTTDLLMVNERGGWKLAYMETGLPFS
jgi:hypothetical protein